jgi:transcriptional regulator with XRE-family HTH domain
VQSVFFAIRSPLIDMTDPRARLHIVEAGTSPAQKPDKAGQDIGPRLRAAREGRGVSLRRVAKAVGISASALSQIETSRSRASASTLYALVSELGMSLDELFVDEGSRPPSAPPTDGPHAESSPAHGGRKQPAETRRQLTLESGVVWERLTPTHEPDVDFLYVTYDVGGASSRGDTFVRHDGREYGLVLEGRLGVTVGFESYELDPGDSIAFDSSVPHRLENLGEVPVRAVWLALGRRASDSRSSGLHDH